MSAQPKFDRYERVTVGGVKGVVTDVRATDAGFEYWVSVDYPPILSGRYEEYEVSKR